MWDFIVKGAGLFFDMLRSLLPGIVGRVLSALGIGFASYEYLLPSAVAYVQNFLYGVPPSMIAMLAALRIDVVLTIIFSALAVRLGTRITPIKLPATPS